eukprot:scaffold57951_cov59-Attheya_sp.AAC.3
MHPNEAPSQLRLRPSFEPSPHYRSLATLRSQPTAVKDCSLNRNIDRTRQITHPSHQGEDRTLY